MPPSTRSSVNGTSATALAASTTSRLCQAAASEPVPDAGQQRVRAHDLAAGVHEQEAAGAVGVLRVAAGEARLAEQRRLLVAEDAGDRPPADRRAGRLAIGLAGGADLRQQSARDP